MTTHVILSASELEKLKQENPSFALVDVRLSVDYNTSHIPEAINQCVYEVVFLDELAKHGLTKNQTICVYGAGSDSHESQVATKKLAEAGYTAVYDFQGGLDAWIAAGNAVELDTAPPKQPGFDHGRLTIDTVQSKIGWLGRNLLNKHWGEIGIREGWIEFREGLPQSGEVIIEMSLMTCTDLAGSPLHDVLIHHLTGDDFFQVAKYPDGRVVLHSSEIISSTPGSHNIRVSADLTLLGITHPITFTGSAGWTKDERAAAQASFSIDRTQWGIIYGSGKFFRRLGDHLVNDHIELQVRIVTEPSA